LRNLVRRGSARAAFEVDLLRRKSIAVVTANLSTLFTPTHYEKIKKIKKIKIEGTLVRVLVALNFEGRHTGTPLVLELDREVELST